MGISLPESPATTRDNDGDAGCTPLSQLDMFTGGRDERPDDRWQTLLRAVQLAVDEIGPKEVAYDLDVTPSALSHALAERERHRVPMKWIVYLLSKAPRHGKTIAGYVAAMAGYDLVPRRELTAEEKLDRLTDSLRKNLGPELQRAVLRDAFQNEK